MTLDKLVEDNYHQLNENDLYISGNIFYIINGNVKEFRLKI